MLTKTPLWMTVATIAGLMLLAVPATAEAQQGRGRGWQRQSDYRQEQRPMRYTQLDCCRCACPRYASAERGLRDGRGPGAWQREGRGLGRGPAVGNRGMRDGRGPGAWQREGRGLGRGPAIGNRGLRDGRGPGAWQRGDRGPRMEAQPLPRGRRGPAFDDRPLQREGRGPALNDRPRDGRGLGAGNRWRDDDDAPRRERRRD